VAEFDDVLVRLTAAVTTREPELPLSVRLCDSYRELAGAEGAAITVRYDELARVTLCATDERSARLEDLQDVLGEGPGHSASASGQIEMCVVPATGSSRWSIFVEAAQDVVPNAVIHAVPMHPNGDVFGVITLYQSHPSEEPTTALRLDRTELQFLANVVGVALVGEGAMLDESTEGPWASRAKVHQATGMLVAQMKIGPVDALALLRAHAYAQQTTLSELASDIVERRVRFPIQ
jgi:hypothetical protein